MSWRSKCPSEISTRHRRTWFKASAQTYWILRDDKCCSCPLTASNVSVPRCSSEFWAADEPIRSPCMTLPFFLTFFCIEANNFGYTSSIVVSSSQKALSAQTKTATLHDSPRSDSHCIYDFYRISSPTSYSEYVCHFSDLSIELIGVKFNLIYCYDLRCQYLIFRFSKFICFFSYAYLLSCILSILLLVSLSK